MQKTIWIILFSSFICLANGVDNYIARGDDFYRKFDLYNAYINYKKAFDLSPENYNVQLKLVRTLNDLSEDESEKRNDDSSIKYSALAVKYAERFAQLYPDSASVYSLLAMSYGNDAMNKGGNDKIKLAYKISENARKSLKMDPDQLLSYIILGIYNRQIADLSWLERVFANTFFGEVPDGSFEESLKMLKKAVSIEPDAIVPIYQLSVTYQKMDNEEMEKQLLENVMRLQIVDFRDKYAIAKAKKRLAELN